MHAVDTAGGVHYSGYAIFMTLLVAATAMWIGAPTRFDANPVPLDLLLPPDAAGAVCAATRHLLSQLGGGASNALLQ